MVSRPLEPLATLNLWDALGCPAATPWDARRCAASSAERCFRMVESNIPADPRWSGLIHMDHQCKPNTAKLILLGSEAKDLAPVLKNVLLLSSLEACSPLPISTHRSCLDADEETRACCRVRPAAQARHPGRSARARHCLRQSAGFDHSSGEVACTQRKGLAWPLVRGNMRKPLAA